MSLLLNKQNELGYKALLAINGGCGVSPSTVANVSGGSGNIGYTIPVINIVGSPGCSGSSVRTTTKSNVCSGSAVVKITTSNTCSGSGILGLYSTNNIPGTNEIGCGSIIHDSRCRCSSHLGIGTSHGEFTSKTGFYESSYIGGK